MKQEELIPISSVSTFPGDVWVGDKSAAHVKEGDILEKRFDSKIIESSGDLEILVGDKEEVGEDGNEQLKLENKRSESESGEPYDESESVGSSEKSESVGSSEEKQKSRKDKDCGQVERFDSPKAEGKVQSEVPLIDKKSESVGPSKKTRMRGKELNWRQVARFESPQEFDKSHIKEELDRQMMKHDTWRSSGARNESYVCKLNRKQAWKSCLRKYRVMYLNTSFAILVLSTSDEHHHEEEAGFTTKENYHWTVQQENIVAQSLLTHMNNALILEELIWFNLVNGSGTLPTLLQIGTKKRYMKHATENKEKPAGPVGGPKTKVPSGRPRGRPKRVNQGF